MGAFFFVAACAAALQLAFLGWVVMTVWRIRNALSESVEIQRQQIALQREANDLLRKLATTDAGKSTADSRQDWEDSGEYVIEPTK
jgi:hypothetical protein